MKRATVAAIIALGSVGCTAGGGADPGSSSAVTRKTAALTATSVGPLVVGNIDATNPNGSSVELFNGLPGNEFPEQTATFIPFGTGESVATGDLNGDGIPEIAVGGAPFPGSPRGVTIFDINGNQLDPVKDLGFPAGGFIPGNSVAIGDVNGDGFGDIVVGTSPGAPNPNSLGGFVTVYLSHNATTQAVLGDKRTNTFGMNAPVPFQIAGANNAPNPGGLFGLAFPNGAGLAVCDVDHDGFDEVIVANFPAACADLDHDGFDDVVVANNVGGSTVNVYSVPAASQAAAQFFTGLNSNPPVSQFTSIAAGDLDGDGFAEVAVATPGSGLFIYTTPAKAPFLPGGVGLLFVNQGDSVAIPRPIAKQTAPVTKDVEVAFILYDPPGDLSSVTYTTGTSLATTQTDTLTTSDGFSLSEKFSGKGADSPAFSGGGSVTESQVASTTNTSTVSAVTQVGPRKVNPSGMNTANTGLDGYYMIFNMTGTEVFQPDGTPIQVIWDPTTGTPEVVIESWLEEIALGEPLTVTDLQLKDLLAEISPAQAAELLSWDPNFTKEDITTEPNRFVPFIPAIPGMNNTSNVVQLPNPQGTTSGGVSAGTTPLQLTGSAATGTGTGVGGSLTDAFTASIGTSALSFGLSESTTVSWSSTTTTTLTNTDLLVLGSDTMCTGATISLYRDMAFGGSFITRQTMFNSCTTLPMGVMSFEVLADWQVQNGGTATLNSNAVSGAESFSVTAAPGGWTPMVSIPLTSAMLRGAAVSSDLSKISFALNIPTTQPNQFWVGDAQMFISSPNANVFNQPLGEVNLTGLPEGQFNRIEFTIPSAAMPAITGDNSDVTFTIVLNVNAGTSGWLVDDLKIGE